MSLSAYDVLGIIGVVITIGAYLALQADKLSPRSIAYSLMNGVGSILILISLYFDFNLSSALIETAWLMISIFGLCKALRLSK